MMTTAAAAEPGDRRTARALELVWLVPVVVAAVAALLTTDRLALVGPLLAIALVPWALQAARHHIPPWAFAVLSIGPVAVILAVDGLNASMFLGTTALSVLASRAGRAPRLLLVVAVALLLPFVSIEAPVPFDMGSFYFAIGDLFGVAVGVLLGYSLRLAEQLRAADARLVAAQAQRERARLARDVHDLVAHSLTVVVLHVGGARRVLRENPSEAERALQQAEQVCRESLDAIRRVVGLLRADDDLPTADGDLKGLLQRYRDAGLRIDVHSDECPEDAVPLFQRGVLHRVAQEALSNAARYRTPDSTVELEYRVQRGRAVLRITNAAVSGATASSGGYGLIGLQEQVTSSGGVLSSRYDAGRWRVECDLPIPADETARETAR